ncbi:MAG: alpha-glucosidase [Treponema sp.]|jgi:oligo-1,6-glucosidase|nr:alpha-glucosidase [Treponema sp.]
MREAAMAAWWKERVVYQIYPRSFQDSNGDGIGDIPGIISRLDALKDLGAGIIWLSPVYPSPDADNGYDISDYRDIDPRFGTMTDMEALIEEAGKRDIKIVMDLVINHTSDEHEWFQKSRDPASEYRDYYIWQPPKPGGGLPNNWRGFFVEDAWEFDPRSGEYYLHLFHKKQPDLNYKNPKVIEEIKGILRFWLDKGVAGFRCDVINVLYKTSLANGKGGILPGLERYKCQEGNHEILRELRRDVLDAYDCFTVGESVMVDLDEAKLLCGEDRHELNMVFYFEHLEVDRRVAKYIPKRFKAAKLLEVLTKWQQGLEWNAVYLENHDQSRIVSHYGDDRAYWERSAKLLAVLELTLRGTPFIYQGQEIGMTNFDFTGFEQLNDVESLNMNALLKRRHVPAGLRWKWIRAASRDNARTPMQWSVQSEGTEGPFGLLGSFGSMVQNCTTDGAGFTTGKPWLGINANHRRINYEAQAGDPGSVLSFYKKLIALRASSETLKYAPFTPRYAKGQVIAYDREGKDEVWTAILNFSGKRADLAGALRAAGADDDCVIAASNTGRTALTGRLEPWEALVLARAKALRCPEQPANSPLSCG